MIVHVLFKDFLSFVLHNFDCVETMYAGRWKKFQTYSFNNKILRRTLRMFPLLFVLHTAVLPRAESKHATPLLLQQPDCYAL